MLLKMSSGNWRPFCLGLDVLMQQASIVLVLALSTVFYASLPRRSDPPFSLQWRHNERDDVSNHRRLDCLLNRLFRHRSKKTSKLRVTDLCEGNSRVTGEFPSQRVSNAENIPIWWRHHVFMYFTGTSGSFGTYSKPGFPQVTHGLEDCSIN